METDDYDNIETISVSNYKSYEDFLDKFITHEDRLYLDDEELARDVKEQHAINKGDIKSKEHFEKKKKEYLNRDIEDKVDEKPLSSHGKVFEINSLLWHLQNREHDVRNGRRSTIIFIRYKDQSGKETSAYIDYRERLKSDSFDQIFNGEKDLTPKPTDLSYYNWNTQKTNSNDSTFFRVDAGPKERLSFRNNTDRKIINVDLDFLMKHPNIDIVRTVVNIDNRNNNLITDDKTVKKSKKKDETIVNVKEHYGYQQIVIFDYETRSK